MTHPGAHCPVDPAALLTLVQWLSPGFPTGGFAYSHGLETAISRAEVNNAARLGDWIADVLAFGSGRSDAILLCHALRPGADHAALAALARALAATSERLQETEEMGAALTRATDALSGTQHDPLPYPVALGRAAAALALPPALVAAMAMQAFAANLVAIGVRFVPLGQTDGQRVLADLAPLILRLADTAATAPISAMSQGAIRADIASAAHETLTVRMFRT